MKQHAKSAKDRARARKLEMVSDGMLTVAQAKKFSGFSTWTIYQAIGGGPLPYAQYGKKMVIPRRAMDEWLADRVILR